MLIWLAKIWTDWPPELKFDMALGEIAVHDLLSGRIKPDHLGRILTHPYGIASVEGFAFVTITDGNVSYVFFPTHGLRGGQRGYLYVVNKKSLPLGNTTRTDQIIIIDLGRQKRVQSHIARVLSSHWAYVDNEGPV